MESKVQSPALVMRIIKYAFVVSAFLFIRVAIEIPVQPHSALGQPVELGITIVALICIVVGFLVPRFVFRTAERTYRSNPALLAQTVDDERRYAPGLFRSVILFGLMLRYLGAHAWLVELLFGLGIAAELIWSPGTPPDAALGTFLKTEPARELGPWLPFLGPGVYPPLPHPHSVAPYKHRSTKWEFRPSLCPASQRLTASKMRLTLAADILNSRTVERSE